MSGSAPVRLADRAILLAALLACVGFVVGLRDVAPGRIDVSVVSPPPPTDVVERDAALSVTVVSARDGLALAGATVRVFWRRGDRYYAAGVGRTGARGSAELARLPA